MLKRFANVLGLGLFLAASPAYADMDVVQYWGGDISGVRALFGPSVTVLDWSNAGAPGSATGNINIRNWIDGPGFDNGASPALDLAINGVENVTFHFDRPVSRIGFAMSNGLGNFPTEVSLDGAFFTLLDSNGDLSSVFFDSGEAVVSWIEVSTTTPITWLQFTETGTNIQDQYWGNVIAAAVPEPASWAMMIAGFGFVGGALRTTNMRRLTKVSYT